MLALADQYRLFSEGGRIMDGLAQYLYNILVTALVCSVIQLFPLTGTAKELTKLLCGLVMTISVLSPLRKYDSLILPNTIFDISSDAQFIAREGEWSARNAMSAIIKEECEAYIQNKAAELDAAVTCCVQLTDDPFPTPVSATVTGTVSSKIRTHLEGILTSDLGIAKENITWIG